MKKPRGFDNFHVEEWGLIDYSEAQKKQLEYVDEIASIRRPNTLIFCSHPPVVTLGRGTKPSDLVGWKGAVCESTRGGRATYHGPSQLVIYPLVDLSRPYKNLALKDIRAFLQFLESTLAIALCEIGFQAIESFRLETVFGHQRSSSDRLPSYTGVWVVSGFHSACHNDSEDERSSSFEKSSMKKIASIGIAVKKWITYHGVAINIENDPQAFTGINPCGFTTETMTSLEHEWSRSNKTPFASELLREKLITLISHHMS